MGKKEKKVLTLFAVTMINIVAVDSFRTIPIAAQYGFSLVFYFLIGGIFFLIPSAMVCAELGTGWPQTGGIYIWLREAFGKTSATTIVWINWIYNLSWYPTIMSLIAAVSGYLISPSLAKNKYFIITMILFFFWLSTYLNCVGMKVAAWVSKLGAILGTLIPMIGVSLLAAYYYHKGWHIEVEFNWSHFFPHQTFPENLAFFSTILFALVGLELVATHAGAMINTQRDYPRALLISVIFIIVSICLSSLGMAMIVPRGDLTPGMDILSAFNEFFSILNIPFFTHIISISIVLGGLANVHAWTLGPTKGLMVAAQDKILPKFLTKTSDNGTPVRALVIQGVIVTILSTAYMFMPNVNSAFVFLTIVTSQLAMVVYITVFIACIVLHHKKKEVKRGFKIPGGSFGVWATGISGSLICTVGFLAGFIHPRSVLIDNIYLYQALLVGLMLLVCVPPYLFFKAQE